MIEKRRFLQLTGRFLVVLNEHVRELPVDVFSLADKLKIETLSKTDILRLSHLTESELFACWGNRDGIIAASETSAAISYNDSMPSRRIRFTVSEELMHYVLGHTEDLSFNMFSQGYAPEVYAAYEEEAKVFAGFLLCPPRFFITYRPYINAGRLSEWCNVSSACAEKILKDYSDYEQYLFNHPRYNFCRSLLLSDSVRAELFRLKSEENK